MALVVAVEHLLQAPLGLLLPAEMVVLEQRLLFLGFLQPTLAAAVVELPLAAR